MLKAADVAAALARLGAAFEPPSRRVVAFSGGLDSHVLLHALVQAGVPGLSAVHVDHALHPDSARWSAHCGQVCAALGVPFHALRVDARAAPGESPEAAARAARYDAFSGFLCRGDWLLTAQHQDDQLETVLLQLLRGAGPKGLAGMAPAASLGDGRLLRPLLHVGREDLEAYAARHGLAWCEDPSNANTDIDRNYLRRELLPCLRARWPGAARTVARSARLCAAAAEAVASRAEADLVGLGAAAHAPLPLIPWRALGAARAGDVLRRWMAGQGGPLPTAEQVRRVLDEFVDAGADRAPRIDLEGGSLRRFRGHLHWVPTLPEVREWERIWKSVDQDLVLPDGLGSVCWTASPIGKRAPWAVRPRAGGERLRTAAVGPSRPVKDLLREAGWPPWLRGLMPLIYDADGVLIGVPGFTPGLRWRKPDGSSW